MSKIEMYSVDEGHASPMSEMAKDEAANPDMLYIKLTDLQKMLEERFKGFHYSTENDFRSDEIRRLIAIFKDFNEG